jgi:hypothetical protein
VAKQPLKLHISRRGLAHRGARMARTRGFDGVHRESADDVDGRRVDLAPLQCGRLLFGLLVRHETSPFLDGQANNRA